MLLLSPGFGRRSHSRRPHPWVTPNPVLPQGCPWEDRGGWGKVVPEASAGGASSRRDTFSLCASPKVHQSQRTFFFNETVEMTQRFLTQSPFHRKIPNQLLVATDCSHKSRSVIPGRGSAAYAAPARPREISRSNAITSMGAKTAPKTKCTRDPIQNTSLCPASHWPNPAAPTRGWTSPSSPHPKTPGATVAPKTPGPWVLLSRLPAGTALITNSQAQTTEFFISPFLAQALEMICRCYLLLLGLE